MGPRLELYDVVGDPGEARDRSEAEQPRAEAMRQTLVALGARTRPSLRLELDEQDRSNLVRLGYVGSEPADQKAPPLRPGVVEEGLRDPADGIRIRRLVSRAFAELRDGRLAEGEQAIRDALAADPDNPTFLMHAGNIFIRTGKHSEAAAVLRRSLEIREDASSRGSLAIAHNLMGHKERAIRLLATNASIHPNHLHTRMALGELLLEQGRPEEALEHLGFFLREYSKRDAYLDSARILFERARQQAAGN